MTSATDSAATRSRSLAGRWRDALTDPVRCDRAVALSLAGYVALWTIYGVIAKSSQDFQVDMSELIVWSRDLAFGYFKHPPLAAWLAWLWFGVFPVADWSFYLLAMLMPAIGLWFIWRLSANYLDVEKRVTGLALLTFIPLLNFQVLRMNLNTVLIPLWAITTFCFLRSYRTRSLLYAALTGLCAAACMLGKYWSIVLLASLALGALSDRRRGLYFRSAAPWITAAIGLAVLAPHLVWLVQNDFKPFHYAVEIHGHRTFAASLRAAVTYVPIAFAYFAIPVAIVLAMARAKLKTATDMAWPREPERRLAAIIFWTPFFLPMLMALASDTHIAPLWTMSNYTLLPVMMMSPQAVTVAPVDTRRILGAAVIFPLLVILISPAIALYVHLHGERVPDGQRRLLAIEIERIWHEMTPLPLRYVGGHSDIAYGVAAYAPDKPHALPGLPAPDPQILRRSGMVIACYADDNECIAASAPGAGGRAASRRVETTIVRNYLRYAGKPVRYTLFVIPPGG